MSLRLSPLFDAEGKGTPLLFGQLRARTPVVPVQARAQLVARGFATTYLADWWRVAFPNREPLPKEQIADRQGVASDRFWNLLA